MLAPTVDSRSETPLSPRPALVTGYARLQPLADRPQRGVGLPHGTAGSEQPHHGQRPLIAAGAVGDHERQPDVDLAERSDLDRGREDADDRVPPAVEGDRASGDPRIGREARHPEVVAQHDDGGRAGPVVAGEQRAPDDRLEIPLAEEIRRDERHGDGQRIAAADERHALIGLRREALERRRLRDLAVVAGRQLSPFLVRSPIGAVDGDEAIGVADRQRAQDQQVGEAEDDGVGGDREPERENDDERGAALARHQAKAIAQILPEAEKRRRCGVGAECDRLDRRRLEPGEVPDERRGVEIRQGGEARLGVRHPAGPELVVALLEMLRELVDDFALPRGRERQRREAPLDGRRPVRHGSAPIRSRSG